jgi:hypothetical protein
VFKQGHCKIFPGRRDAARAVPRLGVWARPRPEAVPGHVLTEAASKSCPFPCATRRPSGEPQRTAGPFHAPPAIRSSLGRRVHLGMSPSILGCHKGALTLYIAPSHAPPPPPALQPCRHRSPPRRAASSGLLRTKTSCSPPSLASAIASRAVPFLSQAAAYPERGVSRSATAGAAASPRRPFPLRNRAWESVP